MVIAIACSSYKSFIKLIVLRLIVAIYIQRYICGYVSCLITTVLCSPQGIGFTAALVEPGSVHSNLGHKKELRR